MKANPGSPKSVAEYIAMQPEEFRLTLEKLRSIILGMVPQAEELISYQVPCFRYLYMLVGIGVNKKYCSFFIMSTSLVKVLKEELKEVKLSGTTLHFMPQEPLPVALLEKIITARIKENENRALKKHV